MSDTNAESQTSTPAPAADIESGALADLQRDNADLAAKLKDAQSMLSGLTSERDALKGTLTKLEPQAKEAVQLKAKLEDFGRKERENALVEKLRGKLPGASALEIKGTLLALHEAGKANRYAEDADAELAKLIPLINSEAPGLTRPAIQASGSSIVRPSTRTGYRGPFSQS